MIIIFPRSLTGGKGINNTNGTLPDSNSSHLKIDGTGRRSFPLGIAAHFPVIWSFFDDLKPKKNEVWHSDLHHMETVGNWTSADLKGTELCGIWFLGGYTNSS